MARYEQIKTLKEIVKSKWATIDHSKDIVLVCGDFNQNATMPLNASQLDFLSEIAKVERYKPLLPLFCDEYGSMLNALKNKADWQIVDCLRTAKSMSPPTYADISFDSEGEAISSTPLLYDADQEKTQQALDYIFWLRDTKHKHSFEVEIEETQLEKLPGVGLLCRNCSDHFGISTTFSAKSRPLKNE